MFAMKRFVEDGKITLVLKTFLEDASHTPPSDVLIGNHTAWYESWDATSENG